jgi:hypothetical protein
MIQAPEVENSAQAALRLSPLNEKGTKLDRVYLFPDRTNLYSLLKA